MSKSFIVLDTETTGLPQTPGFGVWYHPSDTRHYDSSRVIQVAVVSETESFMWYIKPEDFQIENSEFHGITQDIALSGVSWDTMIAELMDILGRYDVIVGHNILFDLHVIAAELYRREQSVIATQLLNIPYECTMCLGKLYMKSTRFPKLVDLYEHIYKKKIQQTHDAIEDCKTTFDCYIGMKHLPDR